MMLPDCRNDDYYNVDFVDGDDSNFVDGFDWCVEMAVDNFFDNDMSGLMDAETYLGKLLSEELPQTMQEIYVMEYSFPKPTAKKPEERKCKTYADLIRLHLLAWIEMERNELITSMVDNLATENEDVYDAIRNKKLRDNEKLWGTDAYKEYYDTRKFAMTGKKEFDMPEKEDVI